MERRVCLIVNPSAGGGRAARVLPSVEDALRRRGVSFHTELTGSLAHAVELGRTAAAAGEAAVTLGGDGLAGAVAGALTDGGATDGVLGVLPGGRGNDLARVLGIPGDAAAAVDVIAAGHERLLDVGDAGGRAFVGIASCGLDSDANRHANEARLIKGNLVYLYGGLRALAAWKPARFELELDGKREVVRGYGVAAANSKAYGGGMYAAPDAELDDGLLDVVVAADMPKRRFVTQVMLKAFKGTHVENPDVHVFRAREVRIVADRPFVLYADGDPIGELPVTVGVRHRVLRMLVP
jgi:YegS/Rv2252/BmrU family lipid kinase